jgi:UDP-2,3-diacylglucosamine pyrophosphatase LpxH
MKIRKIKLQEERILVVGPIYDKIDKLYAINDLCQKDDIVVFLGDIAHPYQNTIDIMKRITTLMTFCEGKNTHYILGDYDFIFKNKASSSNLDACDWFARQLLGVRFTYANDTNILVIHGGILAKHKKLEDLEQDPEISFVKNWHTKYDGRFGYVVASHPAAKNNKIKTYNYSASLDTLCYESNVLAVQAINNKGLGETFYI